LNEKLVQQGHAVVQCNINTSPLPEGYQHLMENLLKVELKADKKGVGMWTRETVPLSKRIMGWLRR